MLTDTALKSLKPKDTPYKVTDRDGMYVTVSSAGTVTFRYDYRINGRRETLTIGRYGPGGLSLARAREKCIDAKRAVSEGQSCGFRLILPAVPILSRLRFRDYFAQHSDLMSPRSAPLIGNNFSGIRAMFGQPF